MATVYSWVCQWKSTKVADDGKHDINQEYPDLVKWYGILSGLAFTASFAVFGIFGGVVADRAPRAILIGIACMLWSACTLLTGIVNSFFALFAFRFLLGFFEAFFNPCSYSLIADCFHPDYRTTANSLFNSGIYLGGALASLTTLIIVHAGWRAAYIIVGIIGAGFGLLSFLFIREPERNQFDKSQRKEQKLSALG